MISNSGEHHLAGEVLTQQSYRGVEDGELVWEEEKMDAL